MRGFTLLETIIYIALFGLIMGGTLTVVYQLLESSGKISTNTTVQEEGNFVLRKLDWALSGASVVSVDTTTSCQHTLHVSRYSNTPPTEVYVRRNTTNNTVEISQDGTSYLPITTTNVSANCLKFRTVTVGSIIGVTATTTLGTTDFATTKYIRK